MKNNVTIKTPRRLSFRDGVVAVLYALLLARFLYLYSTVDLIPGHVDEPIHIQNAYVYKLFFVDRDFSNKDWSNFISYDETPVGKYIFGFALHVINGKLVDSPGGQMDWHRHVITDWFKNPLITRQSFAHEQDAANNQSLIDYCDVLLKQLRPVPATSLDGEDFRICRMTVLLFGVLATGLLIMICFHISRNIIASMFAGLLFVTNHVTIPGFQQALIDSFWCFFVLLSLVLLFRLFLEIERRQAWRRIAMFAVLVGVSLSLALGTKLIAAYMAVTIALSFLANMLLIIREANSLGEALPTKDLLVRTGAFALIAISSGLVFILLNPFLYHDCISNGLVLFHHRRNIMEIQAAVQFPAIHSILERLEAILRYGILLGYKVDGWLGGLFAVGYLCTLGIGLKEIVQNAFNELSRRQIGPHALVLIWITTAFVMIGYTVNMQWERYFLPMVMCTVLVFGQGVATILKLWKHRIGITTEPAASVGNETEAPDILPS